MAKLEDIRDALGGGYELYRALFEQSPVGVFLYDRSMRFIDFNPRLVEMLTSSPEAVRAFDLQKLEGRPVHAALVRALDGHAASYEGPMLLKGTSGLVVHVRVTPLRDGDGHVVAGLGTVEDVSARVAAQLARATSEKRLSLYVEQNPLAVIFWNTRFEIIEWNESAARIFGYSAPEVLGLRGADLLVPEPVRGYVDEIWESLLAGQGTHNTNANVTKDGRTILCEWHNTPLVDENENVVGVASIVADVTDRIRESDALKRSEARFRSLAELTPDAISVIRNGRFLYANPALARYLGYASPEELMALPTSVMLPAEELAKADEHMVLVRKQRFVPPVEYRLLRQDGDVVTCEMMSMQIDFDGDAATLSTMRDLSERKQMQARLLQSDRMASVGTLAAGVAHEINNPLAYMKANLDVLIGRKLPDLGRRLRNIDDEVSRLDALRELLGDAGQDLATHLGEIASMIAIVQEGTERVRGIVRDLKTFSRADDETATPVDVARVLDASINLAWNEIRHRATLRREYGEVPPVEANESRLGQVFLNLLLNAAQAIPDSGDVAGHEIHVRCATTEDGMVRVSVSDSGVGIPKDALARIFDPFYTTKPVGVGTGLGLWVCQGIVTSLKGKIDVQSDVGSGTTVTVVLPSRYAGLDDVPAPRTARRGRVLVIDEEPVLGSALSIALYAEHDVIASTNGRDAIALVRRHGLFDVVFCQAELPDMTALDVYRAVAAENPALAPRFVFAMGRAVPAELDAQLAALPNERITRPFDVGTLIDVVRDQIARTRPSLIPPPR